MITRIKANLSLTEFGLTSKLELSLAKRESEKRTYYLEKLVRGGPKIKRRKNFRQYPSWRVGLKKRSQFQFGNFEPPWGALNFQKTGNVKKHLRMPKFYLRGGQHFPNYSKIRNV